MVYRKKVKHEGMPEAWLSRMEGIRAPELEIMVPPECTTALRDADMGIPSGRHAACRSSGPGNAPPSVRPPIAYNLARYMADTSRMAPTRCILLFARTAEGEARAKRLSRARALFAFARGRVLAAARSLPETGVLVVGPRGDLPQRGDGFAERLANAFADARALGYREIVAVPTDVPRLGRRQLAEAFRRLAATDVVLGPSPDGGAYLIGCRNDPSDLFAGVRWQTSQAFADLAANAGNPAVLDPLEDVDRWDDVLALSPELLRLVATPIRIFEPPRPASRIAVSDSLFQRPPPSPALA